MKTLTTPLVSICVITYNHENYIRQAVESILSQKIDFPIEIIIGEDSSTDDTSNIVLELERKHPQIIRVLLAQKNLGTNRNLIRTMEHCKGKYIALLGGDDFWLSPFKLKKQVEFLEDHPECTICFHSVEVYIQETGETRGVFPDYEIPIITTIIDLIKDSYMPACAVMYRNIQIEKLPDAYYDLKVEDLPLSMIYAKKGKIGYINEVMAQYRYHSKATFSQLSFPRKLEIALSAREFIYKYIVDVPKKELGTSIITFCFQIANLYCDEENKPNARKFLLRSLDYFFYYKYFPEKFYILKVFLRVFFPRLFSLLGSINSKIIKIDN